MDPLEAYRAEIREEVEKARHMPQWEDVLRVLDAQRGQRRQTVERDLRNVVEAGITGVRSNQKAPVRDDTRDELDGLVAAVRTLKEKRDSLNPYARTTVDYALGSDAPDADAMIDHLLQRAETAREHWTGNRFRHRGTPARLEVLRMCWQMVNRAGYADKLPKTSEKFRNLCSDVLLLCGDDKHDKIGGLLREVGN